MERLGKPRHRTARP